LKEGEITAGDKFTMEDRPHPEWPLARIMHVLFRDTSNWALLEEMAGLEHLADSARLYAQRRIASRKVEDWQPRVETPAE